MRNNQFFIPIGDDIKSHFDYKSNLIKSGRFKFLFIKEVDKNNWQILLSAVERKKLHVTALLAHMQSLGLMQIIVHGGGIISLNTEVDSVIIAGKSYTFKSIVIDEFISVFKNHFPDAEIDYDDVIDLDSGDELYHKIYTLTDIVKEIESLIR